MTLEAKVRQTVEHCGDGPTTFLKGTRTQKTGTSSNVKEAEFLRSYLRPLFSCRPRFAASSPAGDNWRNTLRVVKRTPSVKNVSVSLPPPRTPPLFSLPPTQDKRRIQENIAIKRRQIEDEKLKLQYIKVHGWLGSQGPAAGSRVSGRGCVAVIVAGVSPTVTKKETANSPPPPPPKSDGIALWVLPLSQS